MGVKEEQEVAKAIVETSWNKRASPIDVPRNLFHSRSARIDTTHTLSVVAPHLRVADAVLDVGCGSGYVTWCLAKHQCARVSCVDIVDSRRAQLDDFHLYDGVSLPFADASFDVVMLNFVLHHIPNETKSRAMAEVRRVAARSVIVLEDTPRNWIDRYFSNRHGRTFQRQINSQLPFGFYSQPEWETWFSEQGFAVRHSQRISRFARDWRQPYARSCFVLEKFAGP